MVLARSPWEVAADILDPPDDNWRPHPHQLPPVGDWFIWLLLGGRGAGKTAACARYMHEHVNGPPCIPGVPGGHWPAIIAPTLGDGVTSCVLGPSGLRIHDPAVKVAVTPGGTVVKWPNGTEGKIFGAHTPEDVERLRSGGNRCIVWAEELAAWRYMEEAWQHMRYGLRVGPRPHAIASTTPKNRTLIKKLIKESEDTTVPPRESVKITKATTDDNPNLPAHIRKMLYQDYAGTRLGRQELLAEILDDVEGALWSPQDIDLYRIPSNLMPRQFNRIVIGVDPPAKSTGDECGIVVVGRVDKYKAVDDDPMSKLAHGFVLADYSAQGTPLQWAENVRTAYDDWGANLIVAEINNGGDMVKSNIHSVDPSLPVHVVHATKGKAKRAEPVVGIYQQGRMHHVGYFGMLEDQMTGWDQEDPPDDWSPDRMDALVWAATFQLVGRYQAGQSQTKDNRYRGRR